MKLPNTSRLHALRMENDAAGYRMADNAARFDSLRDRHTNGTAPQAISAFNLFQTPCAIAEQMAASLDLRGGERILEPSAGLGRLIEALIPYKPLEVVAVEESPDCCRALFQMDFPGVTLKQGDFLALPSDSLGQFDAVLMNPPFKMGADIRHIMRAFDLLCSGGKLVALCYAGSRQTAKLKPWADSWELLPGGSFASEGTRADVAMITKRKP